MQKIVLNAGISSERAYKLIRYFTDNGFSVSAKHENKSWEIAATRTIDPELEKRANRILESAGIAFGLGITHEQAAKDTNAVKYS